MRDKAYAELAEKVFSSFKEYHDLELCLNLHAPDEATKDALRKDAVLTARIRIVLAEYKGGLVKSLHALGNSADKDSTRLSAIIKQLDADYGERFKNKVEMDLNVYEIKPRAKGVTDTTDNRSKTKQGKRRSVKRIAQSTRKASRTDLKK